MQTTETTQKQQLITAFSDDFLANAVADFCDLKALTSAPKTVKTYAETLAILTAAFPASTVSAISEDQLTNFFGQVRADRSEGGFYHVFTCCRVFFRWFFDDDPNANPMRRIKISRPKHAPKQGIPLTDVQTIIKKIKGPTATRDRFLFALLSDTGLRRAELCALTWADMDDRQQSVTIRAETAKRKKGRTVFFGSRTRLFFRKYVRWAAPLDLPPESPLWVSRNGSPLSIGGVHDIIKKYAGDYDFHDFRRCCAVSLKRNGADIKDISRVLGHADLRTTEIYLALDNQDNKKTAVKYSPLDN